MASRYTRLSHSTLNDVPLIQLPFEQLDQVLGQAQASKDMFDKAKDMMPDYLKEHSEYANKYSSYVDDISNKVSEAFASGDTKRAMNMMRQGQRAILSEWKKGGLAYALQTEHDSYQKQLQAYKDLHKDSLEKGIDINYNYGLMKHKIGGLNYDLNKRTWDQVRGPSAPAYYDYNKDLLDWVKETKAGENDQVVINGGYVYVNGTKKYNVEELASQFVNDPRVQNQLNIESEYKYMNLTDAQKQGLLEQHKNQTLGVAENFNNEIAQIETLANSKDVKERMGAQQYLQARGLYNGKIDGDIGEKSKKALEDLKAEGVKLQKEYEDITNDLRIEDLPHFFKNDTEQSLIRKAMALRPDSNTIKNLQADWRAKMALQFSYDKKLQDDYITKMIPTNTNALLPQKGLAQSYDAVSTMAQDARKAVEDTRELIKQDVIRSPELIDLFGSEKDPKAAAEQAMEMGAIFMANQGKDKTELMKLMGIAPDAEEKFNEIVSAFERHGSLRDNLNALGEQMRLDDMYQKQQNYYQQQYESKNPNAANLRQTIENLEKEYKIAYDRAKNSDSFHKGKLSQEASDIRRTLEAAKDKYNNLMQEDINKNFDQYSAYTPTGVSTATMDKDTKGALNQFVQNNYGDFTVIMNGKKTGEPNRWLVGGRDGKGYEEKKNISIKAGTLNVDAIMSQPGGGISLELAAEDVDGNPVKKTVILENPAQIQYMQTWAKGALLDAKEANDMGGMHELAKMLDPDFYTERVVTPETGKKGTVQVGNSVMGTNFNILKTAKLADPSTGETKEVVFLTYNDADKKQRYMVGSRIAGNDGLQLENSFAPLPGPSGGVLDRGSNDYDELRATFDMMQYFNPNSGFFQDVHRKRKPSDVYTTEELNEKIRNQEGLRRVGGRVSVYMEEDFIND